jgi:hypothetical protein
MFKTHGLTSSIVIESHLEERPSLRIDKPFPALLQYAQSLDLDALDPTEYGHVPYIYILIKAINKWKQEVGVPSFFTTQVRNQVFLLAPWSASPRDGGAKCL